MKKFLIILGILLLLLGIQQPALLILAIITFYLASRYKGKKEEKEIGTENDNSVNQPQNNTLNSSTLNSQLEIAAFSQLDLQPQITLESSSIKPSKQKHFYFNVAGITKKNDKGKDIQRLIQKYVKKEIELQGYSYNGMTDKEIYESGEDRVYEADISGSYEIIFEPEPNNPHDPNAIKVIHKEIGHVGYVPREYTDRMHHVLKNKEYEIEWKLVGGKYKYIDYEEDKVKTETLNYGITIDVYYT